MSVPRIEWAAEPDAALPRGIGAFFDMDNTLLSASSGRLYLRYLRQTGRMGWQQWLYISAQIVPYVLGVTDFPHLMSRVMTHAAGANEAETWRLSQEWFDAMLCHYIAPAARERVDWHRQQGHHVAIVSASTPYAVRPVAEALGLGQAYLATHLEIVNGQLTGRVVEPACYGPGKVGLTLAYADAQGLDLRQSYFYSDSHHDLPLLEAVGHPVAVNPNRRLRRIATERGWPVMRFY